MKNKLQKSANKLAKEIAEVMYSKKEQLDDEMQGTSVIASGQLDDMTNPKLILDKSELRKESGRKIIRKAFVQTLEDELKKYSLTVKNTNGKLEIKTVSITENNFTSLSSMK